MPESAKDPLNAANRIILSLMLACCGLLAVIAYLLLRSPDRPPPTAPLLDPEVRQQVVSQLVADSAGIYDSHVDPDVGRILMPDLEDRENSGITVSTNRFGMRERQYEMPKPEGVVRIVLLGDSYVFGFRAAAEDRLGVHLERQLRERATGFGGHIECLHLGVPSWNIRSEAAFLRRQLSDLRPDLVVHVIVPNDLGETQGTRGFGVPARFSPQRIDRADSLISAAFPRQVLGFRRSGYLWAAVDWESRSRYRAAAGELRRLAEAVEAAGSEYRLLVHFRQFLPLAHQHLAPHLDSEQVAYLSSGFGGDRSYFVAPDDSHWNREGHRKVAQLIYGLIVRDDLLPRLGLPAWGEATAALREIADAGRREAARQVEAEALPGMRSLGRVTSSLEATRLDEFTATQVHGGIDRRGRVSPYASFLLENPGDGTSLRIEGRTFPRPELNGARVRVFVDAEEVGVFEIRADREIDLTYPLPAAAAGRSRVSVRFEADDYVYTGQYLQRCVVFQLQRVALSGSF